MLWALGPFQQSGSQGFWLLALFVWGDVCVSGPGLGFSTSGCGGGGGRGAGGGASVCKSAQRFGGLALVRCRHRGSVHDT